jgi:hypothetical protein
MQIFLVRLVALLLALTFACAVPQSSQAQGRRVALIIGNSAYLHTGKLDNPLNDADDMAATLERLSFKVIKGTDLTKSGMDAIIREFAESMAGAKAGLFFYAGHGLQVGGQNYLVPVDARLTTASALDFETVRLDLVQRLMEREAPTNIVILDACRDNPLARNLARAFGTRSTEVGRGFAPAESGEGTLISFSTQPGNVALDGAGRNSPFAAALLKHISTPGDDLPTILIKVRNDVMAATERKQIPWEHSALTARFFFAQPSTPSNQEAELALWNSVKESNDPAQLRTYLQQFPRGSFVVVANTLIDALEAQRRLNEIAELERQHHAAARRKAEEDARVAQEAAKRPAEKQRVASLPTGPSQEGDGSFDGRWDVTRVGAQCTRGASVTFSIDIRGSVVSGGSGSISPDGTFKYERASGSTGRPMRFSGNFRGQTGSGTFYTDGGTCKGTFTAQRK